LLCLLPSTSEAVPLGSGFTYQGRLNEAGQPVNGNYNFVVTLWDAPGTGSPPVGGTQIGGPDNEPATQMTDGLFTVILNDANQFGAAAFNGDARWIQISVNGTVLGPRQPLTAAPYALRALSAPGDSGFWSANSTHIFNNNAGRVGVGISSPDSMLHVSEGSAGAVTADFNSAAAFERSTTTYLSILSPSTNERGILFGDPESNVNGGIIYNSNSTQDGFQFRSGGNATHMVLTGAGDLGIGTTSPTARLEVSGGVGQFGLRAISPDIAVYATHDAPTGSSPGVYGVTNSESAGAHGVRGLAAAVSPANDAAGVHGVCSSNSTGMGVSGLGFWGVYGEAKSANGFGGVFLGSDGLFGTGRALLAAGDAEVSDSLLVGTALGPPAAAKLQVVNGTDVQLSGGGAVIIGNSSGTNLALDENEIMARGAGSEGNLLINREGGNVLIGSASGGTSVLSAPIVQITGGADLSESFDITGTDGAVAEPGTVVCIDAASPGKLRPSTHAYDRTVAGVISGAGGVRTGMLMGQAGSIADGSQPVALSGRVYVRCDARDRAIEAGDLLTTSSTAGRAMKVLDHVRAQGAVLGKAMTALEQGKLGLVLVLVQPQ
jgi:hypothetical protein